MKKFLPSLAEFRALDSYEWHIGSGTKDAKDFVEWLSAQIAGALL